MPIRTRLAALLPLLALSACGAPRGAELPPPPTATRPAEGNVEARLARYTPVRLTADLAGLTPREREMIPILIEAAQAMDEIFWVQAYGDREELMRSLDYPPLRRYAELNYGPWDRLDEDEPFVPGVGPKAPGANFYPRDMTREEFERAAAGRGGEALRSLYTLVRRDAAGRLIAIPYHEAFRAPTERAAALLRDAATLADDPGLRRYLELRAAALLTDDFRASDLAWMDMKNNTLDVVIGPIETYEDQLLGAKASHEAFVLIKDREWSRRLERYIALLPGLQRGLPVPAQYRRETPGRGSDLNAYDAVYYAGEANAGAKTIAINLPNDEQVQLEKGTRRLQLKNAMRAKYDAILVPIARELIVPEQQANVTFDAFFENTMFHEVAHGLGIKNTVDGRGTVREALRERASGLEEEKADVLGLHMVTQLTREGELPESELADNYITFLAGLFRSVRFGAADAHGQANMATFNFFQEQGAFTREPATGKYRVDLERMQGAVNLLSEFILRLQGDGNYDGVGTFMAEYGRVVAPLDYDLARLTRLGIPVDVTFQQGVSVLGLED